MRYSISPCPPLVCFYDNFVYHARVAQLCRTFLFHTTQSIRPASITPLHMPRLRLVVWVVAGVPTFPSLLPLPPINILTLLVVVGILRVSTLPSILPISTLSIATQPFGLFLASQYVFLRHFPTSYSVNGIITENSKVKRQQATFPFHKYLPVRCSRIFFSTELECVMPILLSSGENMNKISHYIACHLSEISINQYPIEFRRFRQSTGISTINGFKLSTLVALLQRANSDSACVYHMFNPLRTKK